MLSSKELEKMLGSFDILLKVAVFPSNFFLLLLATTPASSTEA
jgi:hypothetical protein